MHVIRHAAQDGVGNRFRRIAPCRLVAMDFLDPFQIDDRNDTDLEITMLGKIDLVGHRTAMQAFIEQEIGVLEFFPTGEGAGRCAVAFPLFSVMDVVAGATGPAATIFLENAFQQFEFVRFRVEMGKVPAIRLFFGNLRFHPFTVEAMESVTLDEGCCHLLAGKDLAEGLLDGRGSRAGGACNGNDGVLG